MRGDAGQLTQVLLNLCLNARDALEEAGQADPRIVVRARMQPCGAAQVRGTGTPGTYLCLQVEDSGGETILVIDDESLVRHSMSLNLRQVGYTVLEATSGEMGAEIAQREQVDLVLMDWSMPGWSGWEILAALRTLNPQLPVIVCSGYLLDQEQLGGCAVVLQKPVPSDQMNEAVRRVLKKRRIGV